MLIAFIRTIVFYFITMLAIRVMGKRQIGQLEPTELVVTIMISELATLPIQDLDTPLVNSFVSIFTLVSFEIIISVISMKSSFMRRAVSGKYSIIIDNGKINVGEMKKVQLTVDELMEELRQSDILSPKDVRYCILETSGKMSVLSKKETEHDTLPLILVSDGKVVEKNLETMNMNKKELEMMVESKYGMKTKKLFMLLYANGEMTAISRRGDILDC